MSDDTRPFPIQEGWNGDNRTHYSRSTIPWWLAEEAYKEYHDRWSGQSLERLGERGGFGREELLMLLRRERDA